MSCHFLVGKFGRHIAHSNEPVVGGSVIKEVSDENGTGLAGTDDENPLHDCGFGGEVSTLGRGQFKSPVEIWK